MRHKKNSTALQSWEMKKGGEQQIKLKCDQF